MIMQFCNLYHTSVASPIIVPLLIDKLTSAGDQSSERRGKVLTLQGVHGGVASPLHTAHVHDAGRSQGLSSRQHAPHHVPHLRHAPWARAPISPTTIQRLAHPPTHAIMPCNLEADGRPCRGLLMYVSAGSTASIVRCAREVPAADLDIPSRHRRPYSAWLLRDVHDVAVAYHQLCAVGGSQRDEGADCCNVAVRNVVDEAPHQTPVVFRGLCRS